MLTKLTEFISFWHFPDLLEAITASFLRILKVPVTRFWDLQLNLWFIQKFMRPVDTDFCPRPSDLCKKWRLPPCLVSSKNLLWEPEFFSHYGAGSCLSGDFRVVGSLGGGVQVILRCRNMSQTDLLDIAQIQKLEAEKSQSNYCQTEEPCPC